MGSLYQEELIYDVLGYDRWKVSKKNSFLILLYGCNFSPIITQYIMDDFLDKTVKYYNLSQSPHDYFLDNPHSHDFFPDPPLW